MIIPVQPIRAKVQVNGQRHVVIMVVGLVVFFSLMITVSFFVFRPRDAGPGHESSLSLATFETGSEQREYIDPICQVSFAYPANWQSSQRNIPLPGEPLHTITFDVPAKAPQVGQSAILSYICLDAKQYSFEQLLAGNSNLKPQVEGVGGKQWQRLGSFAASTFDDKLLVFYMPFTKYDLKPRAGYEDVFLTILRSVKATN